ncbi:hypothetical protein [Cohnella yongneupensis]|uniref:Flagellar protein n=1 Tax=Cohnella yongneupensis TaxID=425006 RepID=A0ABW0R5X6_9BACL
MSKELRVAHCPKCGKIYQINMRNMCSTCSNEEDTTLRTLEVQLLRNRRMTNEQLAEASSVPADKIQVLIRAGKLKLFDYPNLADACDRCRGPIRKGTLCLACATQIQDDITHALEQERLLKERMRQNTYFARD